MPRDALAEVGLADPGGDPRAMHGQAQGWHDLSAFLEAHGRRIASLADTGAWQGESADAFSARVRVLAQDAADIAQTAKAVGEHQEQHARTHSLVVRIIKELAIQIAVMLAFWAAAAAFPALLAWAQAWLTYLISTGVRALTLLARALEALVQFFVRSRVWITKVMDLSLQGGRFTVGYGRAAVEGVRDIAIDLTANLVSAGIQHKPIDPASLFISAGISGGIGGVVGGLEKSGVTKVVGPDGVPRFTTFDKQVKDFVAPPPPRPPVPSADEVLTRELTVRAYQGAVDEAGERLATAETMLEIYRAAGNPKWVDDGVREVADARRTVTAATEGLGDARAALAEVRPPATIGEHLSRVNAWRAGFGSPKAWRETVLYDVPKDMVKGVANGAAKSGVDVARGTGEPGDVWKDAVLGGATGAVRGGVNSVAGNRAFPASGIEETLWKTGGKTLDDYVRRRVEGGTYGARNS